MADKPSGLAAEIIQLNARADHLLVFLNRVNTAKANGRWLLYDKVVGGRLRRARYEAHLTQSDVADLLECAPSALAVWERGRNQPPLKRMFQLAVLYGVPVSDLCGQDNGEKEKV